MPAFLSSTSTSLTFPTSTTESSSLDSHSSFEEVDLSHYQQLLEDIPEDVEGGCVSKIVEGVIALDDCIGTFKNMVYWIQKADLRSREQLWQALEVMIDQSIQEINSKHGQPQASDMHRLLKLARAVVILRPSSPENLSTMLRLYMTLETFPVNQVNGIPNELRRSVRQIFYELELCVLAGNDSYIVPKGGGIHKVTEYLMNYIKVLWEHDSLLNVILAQGDGEWRRLEYFVESLIRHLDSLLERISKCNSTGFRCIFLLNNFHFILGQLQKLEVKSALQQSWIAKHHNQVEHYISRYLEYSWEAFLPCLDRRANVFLSCFHPPPVTRFYEMLESTCAEQENWRIEDPQLRQVVRKAVSSRVVQCYQAYLQRCVKHQKHARCTPQELENKLMDLFEG